MSPHPAAFLGLDIGSTTVKLALLDAEGMVIETMYRRHGTAVRATPVSYTHLDVYKRQAYCRLSSRYSSSPVGPQTMRLKSTTLIRPSTTSMKERQNIIAKAVFFEFCPSGKISVPQEMSR